MNEPPGFIQRNAFKMKANDLKTMHALYPNSPSNSKPSYLHQLLMLSSQRRLYSLMFNMLRLTLQKPGDSMVTRSMYIFLVSWIFFFCHEWNQVLKPEWQFLLLFLDAKNHCHIDCTRSEWLAMTGRFTLLWKWEDIRHTNLSRKTYTY